MKLVRVVLPLATTLAVGTAGLYAVQASPLPVPPPASAPKTVVPAPKADTEYKGARILLRSMPDIPRCYLVYGLQSYAGIVKVTDQAGHPIPVPSRPQVLSSVGTPLGPR